MPPRTTAPAGTGNRAQPNSGERFERAPDRRYMRWSPEISAGNVLQVVSLIVSLAIGYATYREDQTRQDGKIEQIESTAKRDREDTQRTLAEIRLEMKEQGKTLGDLKEGIAILRGRAAEPGSKR